MTFLYVAAALIATAYAVQIARAAWHLLPDRTRYLVRLALRRMYIIGPYVVAPLAMGAS